MSFDDLLGDIAVAAATVLLGAVLALGHMREARCEQPRSQAQVQATPAR